MNRFKNGFTLIELITVILIIGILSSIAFSNFGRTFNALSRGEELKKIITNIEFARDFAMARENQCWLVVNNGVEDWYSLHHGRSVPEKTPVPLPGNRGNLLRVELPDFMQFSSSSETVIFNSRGTPGSSTTIQFSSGHSISIEHPSGYVHAQ